MGIHRKELSKPELGCGCKGSRMADRELFPWVGVQHVATGLSHDLSSLARCRGVVNTDKE